MQRTWISEHFKVNRIEEKKSIFDENDVQISEAILQKCGSFDRALRVIQENEETNPSFWIPVKNALRYIRS